MPPPPRQQPRQPPKVFTIPAGSAFVDVLAAGIRDRAGDGAAALAGVTVLVPTRRARRGLAEAFLRQCEGRALLLPKMIALGDLDEDEILLSEDAGSFDVSEAVSGLSQRDPSSSKVWCPPINNEPFVTLASSG